jgi:organic radical activating enzyme
MSNKKDTICTIPWNHQAIYQNGDYGICCQCIYTSGGRMLTDGVAVNVLRNEADDVRNHPTLIELRRSMLNGEKSDLCKLCWDEEELGLKSKRINQQHGFNKTLEKIIEKADPSGIIIPEEFPIEYYDLRLGNLCNMKCRMCGPGDSSLWIEDVYEFGEPRFKFGKINTYYEIEKKFGVYKINSDDFQFYNTEKFKNDIHNGLSTVTCIYFTGGEPLINKKHYEILDYCIDNDLAKNITLEYNTNGTTLNKNLLDQWKNFKSVHLCFSIDGMDEIANYIRYPSKWDVIKKNMYTLDSCDLTNLYCHTNTSLSILNIKHFLEMLDWYHSENFKRFRKLGWHRVVGPDFLNVQVLPLETKKEKTQLYDDYIAKSTIPNIKNQIYGIIDYMNSADSSNILPITRSMIRQLDNSRNQNLEDTISWLAASINYNKYQNGMA